MSNDERYYYQYVLSYIHYKRKIRAMIYFNDVYIKYMKKIIMKVVLCVDR